MGNTSCELQDLPNRLYERARAYVIEVSMGKSKIVVNSKTNTSEDFYMNDEKLEEVTNLKYVSVTMSKDGTSAAAV
ncbi:hypothetical protein DPMN_115345 [Dreissena polymorpha]|uniref:Uncharacterized protein n=1 Tax=Dreissena polymorpha TaxID=45954 RepID=A0A9D4KLV8_DREPO|nr:hypothetical protein DPMN_115345 [Dreissena polymorpha]